MKFAPKTQQELDEARIMPEGEYPFEVSDAEDTTSKSGNEMIKIVLKVFKPDGKFNLVTDYLLASMEYKLRHACEACGILDVYEGGDLQASDFLNKEGTVKISIRKSDQYGDQNQVKDYVVPKAGDIKEKAMKMREPKKTETPVIEGDDIPF